MRIGDILKRQGEEYKIYKVSDNKCFAESEFSTNILCIPNLVRVK